MVVGVVGKDMLVALLRDAFAVPLVAYVFGRHVDDVGVVVHNHMLPVGDQLAEPVADAIGQQE